MAAPVDFPDSNFTWKGWPADADRVEVMDLPTWYDPETRHSVSCWRLSWWERLCVVLTGRVWLSAMGTHPPVRVTGENPFILPTQSQYPTSSPSSK